MDTKNKIFVFYDQTCGLDLAQTFQDLTHEYRDRIIELRSEHVRYNYPNIFFVTSNPENLDIISTNFRKYTGNLQIVLLSEDRTIMSENYPYYVHPIYTDWIETSKKIDIVSDNLNDIFNKIKFRGRPLTFLAEESLFNLACYGGKDFLDFIKKFSN